MCSSLVENGNTVRITTDSLNLSEVVDFVTDASAGGVSIFIGKLTCTSIKYMIVIVDYIV